MSFSIEKIRAEKIKECFIIHKNGLPIFHRAYVSSKIDDSLLSAFLTAVFTLSEELSIDSIHSMDMKDFKFIYDKLIPYIFILNVGKDVDPLFGKEILTKIMDYFKELVGKLSSNVISDNNALSEALRDDNAKEKIDGIINETILKHYLKSPNELLDKIESFLESLFGSMAKDIIDASVSKVCLRRSSFKKEHIEPVISELEDSLIRKMNPDQTKDVMQQIRETFLSDNTAV